jgi:putative ABC transport system permease protein
MGRLGEIWRRVGILVGRERFESELEEEMRLHREMKEKELIAGGADAEEARYAANRAFGNAAYLKEEGREVWGWRWLEDFGCDVHFGLRILTKSPGFTITCVLSLALGIGATTAVFSIIHAVLLSPYPYAAANRIAWVMTADKAGSQNGIALTGSQLRRLGRARSVESVVAQQGWDLSTTGSDLPEDVRALFITPNASQFFGVPALLGRGLLPSDAPDGKDPQQVAVLSYSFWLRHFAGSPDAVGRTLQMAHKNYTIVGVLPRRFAWTLADVYLPLKVTYDPAQQVFPFVRLKPGVSLEAADAEFQGLLTQFAKETPARFPEEFRARTKPLMEQYGHSLGHTLYLLFGAVIVLLFVGCANVSILLLARGSSRQHELAVRAAVGGGTARIFRQLLTESLVLSVGGAVPGVLLAYGIVALAVRWLPGYSYPQEAAIQINLPVLCFSVGLALLAGILFGLSPALQFSRPEARQAIHSSTHKITSGPCRKRTHSALIVAQIALTLLLLTVAGAAIEGFQSLMHTELGYDPHKVLDVGIPMHENTYATWEARAAYFDRLRQKVAAIPEVISAAISSQSTPPVNGENHRIEIMGRSAVDEPESRLNLISSEYFSLLHIPLLRGRVWDETETMRGAQVAVINEAMERRYWPSGSALGNAIRLPELKSNPPRWFAAPGSSQWFQIVGVVADAVDDGLANPVKPAVYVPYTIWLGLDPEILVRTQVPPRSVLHEVRARVQSVDPDQQVDEYVTSLEESIRTQPEWQQEHLVTMLFSAFGLLALVLAMVGLYSVLSYSVVRRTKEFGIRMALGADRPRVVRMVVSGAMVQIGLGLLVGIPVALAGGRALAHQLFGVKSYDPMVLGAAVVMLGISALLAGLVPAFRAASIDPMEALRTE